MVVSVAEWDQLQETIAVLSDPEIRADLAESAEAAIRGDFTKRVGKPLHEPYEGLHTARRGTYRIMYRIDEGKHAIEIRSIRHRADAYRT